MELTRAAVYAGCLLLFLAAGASGNKCTTGCHGMKDGKAYQEGHTYIYDLEGKSVTSVPDAADEATLKLKGTVELSVKPDCIRQIRLKNVQINGAPISLPDVEEHALQFNYHNGHIDTEVCAEPGDSQQSLNIKRAVASLFQSAVIQESGTTSHHEVDVFGGCPTDFIFKKNGDSLVVQKERNLARCSHRENLREGPVSGIYDQKSGSQAGPLVSSHQKIEQRFDNGVLAKAVSVETYKLDPWSNGENNAKTIVQTTLTLKGKNSNVPASQPVLPKSIIFEAPHPVIKSSADRIAVAVKAASAEEHDSVKEDAAEKFAELVRTLRLSSKADILAVYQRVRGNALEKKILLDGLFRTGSGEAAEVIVDLLKNRELSGVQALLFYASLSLVDHVNLPSVTAVTSLLDQPNLPRLGYLGIGQIIGKFCQEHPCDNVAEIKQAVHKIREKVGNGKAKTREQENIIVSALKGLGNARYLDDGTLQKLADIAQDKNVRNRVRVAAIEALPTRCSMKWKTILLKILDDQSEDSEIRIKSYLSLVTCACPHVASGIKKTLDKETVNQVGSFIQSHLRNLRASADPNKAEAKKHLGLIKPRTKFPEDIRKFSFNNELSYNIGGLGIGSSTESNVIYSQNSYVPRSVNLNLTTEIFGRSFNFLELNTRIENLDRLIEHYFGPKGLLLQDDVEDLIDEGKNKAVNISEYINSKIKKLRSKREVKLGEVDKFAKGVKLRNTEVDQQLDLDLSIKLFNVELAYLTYDGNPEQLTPESIIDKIYESIEKGFEKAKKFDYNLQSREQFLDAELIYPTNLGTALSVGVLGTSVIHIKIYGKLDIPAIIKDPKNADISIGFEPSASIRVSGNMVVKGFDVESGLKVVSTLHHDMATIMSVKLLNGNGIHITVTSPKRKEKIISMSSEVLMSSGPKGDTYKAPKFNSKGKVYKDCFEQLHTILGLTFCGHLEYPYDGIESVQKKALFPLNGPAKFSIENENTDLQSIYLKILHEKTDNSQSLEIVLDTPNSKINRHVSLVAQVGTEPNKFAKISLNTPIKKASAEAILKSTPQENTLTITMQHDNQEYYARAGILGSGPKYTPVLEYKVPEHVEKLAASKTGVKTSHGGGQQYNMEGAVEVVDQNGGKKYVFDKVALVSNGNKIVGLDGYVLRANDIDELDMKLNYGEESVDLKLNVKKLGNQHYSVGVSALPSRDPNIGFDFKYEARKDEHEFENNLVFIHGPDLKSTINRFTLQQYIIAKPNQKGVNFILGGHNKISYPALQLKADLEGKITPNSIKGDIDIIYDKFKFGSELDAKRNVAKQGDCELEFEAELLQNKIKVESKHIIVDPHKSKYKYNLELTPGGKYEGEVTITCNRDKNIKYETDVDLNLNGKKVKAFGNLNVENPGNNVQSQAYVTVNDVKYIDFQLKAQRQGANPHGSLSLNVKNYLNVAGEISKQDDTSNARFDIDLPKINRKIKGTGDLVVIGSQHNANFELLYDAEKDPSKRIKLSTVSDIKENTIDSKNVIEVLNHKIELNGKGSSEGKDIGFEEGKQAIEVDVTLSNGHYLAWKFHRSSIKNKNNKYDMKITCEGVSQETKGGPEIKDTYVIDYNNVDPELRTFDLVNAQFTRVHLDGTSDNYNYKIKHLRDTDGHKRLIDVDFNGSGPSLSRPYSLQFKIDELDNEQVSSQLASSWGENLRVKSSANYVPGNKVDKPCKISGNVELLLPSEKLRNVKLDFEESLLDQDTEDGLFDYQSSTALTYNDDKTIKIEGGLKNSGSIDKSFESSARLALKILQIPTIKFSTDVKCEPQDNKMKFVRNTAVSYGDKEATLIIDPLTYDRDLTHIDLKAKATTPYEKLRTIDLELKHERNTDGTARKTDVVATMNGEKYTAMSDIQQSNISPKIHILMTCPEGKTELIWKIEKTGDKEYTGEWKVETPYGYADADAHVNLESIDNFVITVNLDSDKLKYRKIQAELANKPTAKTGKRIIINVTSDGKNIVTGSTNYKKREEDGKITIEGNGNLKIGENMRSSSFKYTRQQLSRDKDGEVGVIIVVNAKFDPAAIVGELKLSNKEVLFFNSYCEQSKDCAHVKLQSSYDTDKKTYLNHQTIVEVDLKKFNIPAEFGLKTSTETRDSKFDHSANLYLHSSKDKSQYSYQVYANPRESGAILTLPSREFAVIGTLDLPKTKQTGSFKLDISVYLDRKNKPSDKSGLVASGDINIEKESGSINGEVKLIYPSQPKDLAVKGRLHYGGEHLLDANVDIDVFAKKTQKISMLAKIHKLDIKKGSNLTSVIEINSRGQQLKVDLKSHVAISEYTVGFGSFLSYTDVNQKPKNVGALFSLDTKKLLLLATGPNKDLLRVDAQLQLEKNLQKVDVEVVVVGNKPIKINFEAQDMNSFKFVEHQQGNPDSKLTANGRFVLGQLADIHADAYKNGAKKNLFHASIHLDEEKFLKPDFGYDKDNIVYVIDRQRKVAIELLRQLKEASVEIANEIDKEMKDLLEHLKKAQPNIKPLLDYYQGELNKLMDELHADQTIKDIQATLNKHFGAIIKAVTDTLKQLNVRLTELQKEYTEIVSQIQHAWEKIYPQLRESYEKIVQAAINLLDSAVNVAVAYVHALLDLINKHQKELKEIAVMVSELAQDIARILIKGIVQLRKDVEEFVAQLKNQLKALPIYEYMKEHYNEIANLQIPEGILASIEEFSKIVETSLPNEELRRLYNAIYNYIMKHAKHEKVDNASELKKIYERATDALASLIKLIETSEALDELIDGLFDTNLPVELESTWTTLPTITSVKLSLINLIRNNELPSPLDLYYTYRPTSEPLDYIPPFNKAGFVVDGGHIFTFDGKHFGIPGDCTYILAQDTQDGNFSVVANFNKGKLVDITVTEPKESITLTTTGVLVNNKPAEFPASTKNLYATVTSPVAQIESDYGVLVRCGYKTASQLCMVYVSGFYHGRSRGLLGDGNNEQYDDYTLPSGKITESETEFADQYKLKPNCPTVNAIDHKKHQRNPACTELFSGEKSPLKKCFNYINPAHYRDACDVAISENPEAHCLLAVTYRSACRYSRSINDELSMPSTCTSCKVGENSIAVGDAFSVKSPKNQADILLVIEESKQNEKVFKDLVPTLITDLREELKQHGITDVHIGLLGFGDHLEEPRYYTTNGDLNIVGDVKNIKFEEQEPIITLEEAKTGNTDTKVDYFVQRLQLELGILSLTGSYEKAVNHLYRPGAVKAVVSILSTPCEKSPLALSLQHLRILVGQKIYRDLGLTYYVVYQPDDIQVSGKAQKNILKNIVGYDSDSVYVLTDSKKKPMSGNTELRSNLVLRNADVCAEFAEANGGAAFVASNLLEAKPNQKRQFAQVTARRIVEGITSIETEEDCTCTMDQGYIARSNCKIVGRREKEPLARSTKGGTKG